jgi:hypothetical protein
MDKEEKDHTSDTGNPDKPVEEKPQPPPAAGISPTDKKLDQSTSPPEATYGVEKQSEPPATRN